MCGDVLGAGSGWSSGRVFIEPSEVKRKAAPVTYRDRPPEYQKCQRLFNDAGVVIPGRSRRLDQTSRRVNLMTALYH